MEEAATKQRAPRNRTLALRGDDILALKKRLIKLNKPVSPGEIENKTIHQDIFEALEYLPNCFVDLVFVDPPYNLNKTFNLTSFKAMESEKYEEWLDSWVQKIIFEFKTALLLSEKRGAAQKQIGKIALRIFGFVLYQMITILMLNR